MGLLSEFQELIETYKKCDPATSSFTEVIFLYPGVRAWMFHKLAHALYRRDVWFFPRFFSEVGRLTSGIDIHPGAVLGARVLMDHGMGIVIGETAVVGDDVLIYQGVTLGGTSLKQEKRHPTIEDRCVLGAGAKILGNIRIGSGSRVGANSVVIRDVPPHSTVVGIPGKVVSKDGVAVGEEFEHGNLPDPLQQTLNQLLARVECLEKQLKD